MSGRAGKKRGKGGKALHSHAPALVAETGILQKHVQMACKKAHHAWLSAPEVVGQRGALLEVIAANGAQSGNAARKALGQPGVRAAQQRQPLAQQGLLRCVIKVKKGRLPHVFKQGAAGSLWQGRNTVERVQAQSVAPAHRKNRLAARGEARAPVSQAPNRA